MTTGAKSYKCNFIQAGLVNYENFGTVLVRKETIDKFLQTFVGKPVVNYHHKDVGPDAFKDGDACGIVTRAWYEPSDGWYWCEYILWDEDAKANCEVNDFSVSCSYKVMDWSNVPGTHNNIPYENEVRGGEYEHLAIVSSPRYEEAKIVCNSKTGGSAIMFKIFRTKEKVSLSNASPVDVEKSMVEIDGKKVALKELINSWKSDELEKEKLDKGEAAEAESLPEDTEIEIDGKKTPLKNLCDSYRNKMKAEAEVEESKKKETAEAEAKSKEDEAAKNAAEDLAKKEKAEAEAKEKEVAAAAAAPETDEEKKQKAEAEAADEAKKKEDEAKAEEGKKKEEVDKAENSLKEAQDNLDKIRNAVREQELHPVVENKVITKSDKIALGKDRY